jgi:hypothetical protein
MAWQCGSRAQFKTEPKTRTLRTMLMTGDLPASGGCAASMALTPFLMFLLTCLEKHA